MLDNLMKIYGSTVVFNFNAGIEKWPGKQIHSHNYRVPEPFRDQVCKFCYFEKQFFGVDWVYMHKFSYVY